jgi:riboflavin synthase
MFTGLVERMGEVAEVVDRPPGKRLTIRAGAVAEGAAVGDSIAINGCCLTIIAIAGDGLSFDAGEETLRRTNLGALATGSLVNLERSLQASDRLGGHFVTGHIDGVGHLAERRDDADWSFFWFRCVPELTRQMASKGSIAVDGVSLTLVDVTEDRFSVALIPHTLQVTTLGRLRSGDPVNLETDLLAKYVARQLHFLQPPSREVKP